MPWSWPRATRKADPVRIRPAVALACSLVLAGALLDRPANRAATLRAVSSISSRTAAVLRRVSLATGLRYVDIAYPSVNIGESVETTSDSRNLG